ncbi:MAG: folate-binding protein YgfZ [Patulibacter sp.]|nr:folate-binding protein YgfZ [Patulibacter sp.]
MDEPRQVPRIDALSPASATAGEDAYRALTSAAAWIDRSECGKLALTGAGAAEFLNGQVTADVAALEPGHGTYAALLTPKGKIITDLRILAVDDRDGPELLLLCERSGLQALFDHLRRHLIGFDAELHKRTVQQTLHSVIGPRIPAALTASLGSAPHDHAAATLADVPVRLARTSLGVDVVATAEDGPAVAAALRDAGLPEVDETAAEIVRVEAGIPRLHHDIDDAVMPAEAGIVEQAVSFTKGCYVGQETVARLHWRGRPNRHLRGLHLDQAVPVGTALFAEEREVGRVSSSAVSPERGPIALALIRREVEPGGTVVARPEEGPPTTAEVVALPFPGTPPATTA